MPQADNTDTTVSEPTVEESVDTSTNEESQDTGIDLEEDNTSFEDLEDTDETEALEDEDTDTEPLDVEDESEEDAEQTKESEDEADDTDESDETEESSDEEDSEQDTSSEDEGISNKEAAARRIAAKQAKEQAKLEAQQRYLEEAEDQKDLALRQLQIDAYNNKVERNRDKLDSGIERAVAGIELFRNGTPEVKEELARKLDVFEQLHVTYDQDGEPVDVRADVYEYLQKEADSILRIQNSGARQQVKAKAKAKARTEVVPSKTPKEPKVDPDMAAFDEEVAKWSQSLKGLKTRWL